MKAYIRGNYFYLETTDKVYEGFAKDVLVKRLTPTSDVFHFKNLNNWHDKGVSINDLEDENGNAYTLASFVAFYEENTGKANGGDSGEGLTELIDNAQSSADNAQLSADNAQASVDALRIGVLSRNSVNLLFSAAGGPASLQGWSGAQGAHLIEPTDKVFGGTTYSVINLELTGVQQRLYRDLDATSITDNPIHYMLANRDETLTFAAFLSEGTNTGFGNFQIRLGSDYIPVDNGDMGRRGIFLFNRRNDGSDYIEIKCGDGSEGIVIPLDGNAGNPRVMPGELLRFEVRISSSETSTSLADFTDIREISWDIFVNGEYIQTIPAGALFTRTYSISASSDKSILFIKANDEDLIEVESLGMVYYLEGRQLTITEELMNAPQSIIDFGQARGDVTLLFDAPSTSSSFLPSIRVIGRLEGRLILKQSGNGTGARAVFNGFNEYTSSVKTINNISVFEILNTSTAEFTSFVVTDNSSGNEETVTPEPEPEPEDQESLDVLAEVGEDAAGNANGTLVTAEQLAILELTEYYPPLISEYHEGITGGAYAFSNPATLAEVQTMVTGVNAAHRAELQAQGYDFVYNPDTQQMWLDRNLGATRVATSSTDSEAYGDLYQWGRAADGHQLRTSNTAAGPVAAGTEGSDFITNSVAPYDWLTVQDDTRWQTADGEHNPCPTGYRLPTEEEWDAERLAFDTDDAAGAFASPLKLPLSGGRFNTSGGFSDLNTLGRYWSSSVNGSFARHFYFHSNATNIANNYRAYSFAVRCIKD